MSRKLLRLKREGGISLKMSQGKRASSRVEGGISCFFRVAAANFRSLSGYDGDLRDPLVGASGTSSIHERCEGPLRISLPSLPRLRSFCVGKAGNSGFLSRADMDLGVYKGELDPVSCGDMQACFPLEL